MLMKDDYGLLINGQTFEEGFSLMVVPVWFAKVKYRKPLLNTSFDKIQLSLQRFWPGEQIKFHRLWSLNLPAWPESG